MTLETATYIDGLNADYPEGGLADRSTADDHLRLIKSCVKATFPNISGAVTVTHNELNLLSGLTETLTTVLSKLSLSISALNTQIASEVALTLGTPYSVSATPVSSIAWTGIPAGTKRVTLMLHSISGPNTVRVILGEAGGGYSTATSSYVSYVHQVRTNAVAEEYTGGVDAFFVFQRNSLSTTTTTSDLTGLVSLALVDAATNLWSIEGQLSAAFDRRTLALSTGHVALPGALDRLRLDVGTDTMTVGKANIAHE